jgi:acyl-CoA reductase-like NAD-dependent aldehyde dehydrogenase
MTVPTFEHDRLFIDGSWITPSGDGFIDVVDPATEEVIGHVPNGDAADVDTAVAAARQAFDPLITVDERRDRVQRVIAAMEKRLTDIAELITAEMGAPIRIAQTVQTQVPLAVANGFADVLETFEFEERIGNSLVLREPYGVVGAITPWNYPLYQVVAKVLPAIAAGCPVVLKPSNEAPLSVFAFVGACEEAGLPPGTINLVSGPGRVIGERLASHPDVDFVSFTGSTGVGARVSVQAAPTVKRVALELGGKSASVVLDDADLAAAVTASVGAAMLNSGQTCSAWSRLLVPADRLDEAVDLAAKAAEALVVGDPGDCAVDIGPLASGAQRETVLGFVRRAVEHGAVVAAGGLERPAGLDRGHYVAPTVLTGVAPDAEVVLEEVFGPVLTVEGYADEPAALAMANATQYGLAGAVWSGSQERAVAFARGMRTGQVDVNGGGFNPVAPFGGYRRSGNGRELGRWGIEEFLETKSVQL